MFSHSQHKELTSLAKKLRRLNSDEVDGQCFGASLQYALLARKMGVELDLANWTVVHDASYCEHWAVFYGATTVVDLTRVQIDGKKDLIYKVTDYPSNFVDLRRYPSSLLLQQYELLDAGRSLKFPSNFMWQSRVALFRHDLSTALKLRDCRKLFFSLRKTLRFIFNFAMRLSLDYLRNRRKILLSRFENGNNTIYNNSNPDLLSCQRNDLRKQSLNGLYSIFTTKSVGAFLMHFLKIESMASYCLAITLDAI
jgi:hypothetical protein